MSKKEKFKKFVEEHESDIAYFMGAGFALLGCAIGCKLSDSKTKHHADVGNNTVCEVLKSASKFVEADVFGGIVDTPMKASELGELGKVMTAVGATDEFDFTHFIAIGESK